MPGVERALFKTLTTQIPLCESRSVQQANLGAGSFLNGDFYNIQVATFLNVFGQADPGVRVAPGHHVSWFLFYAGATTCVVEIWGVAFQGATPRQLAALDTAVATGVAQVGYTAVVGACWEAQVRVHNTGAVAATGIEFAYSFKGTL